MDILTFLNQPIVLTIVTLLGGSYLFSVLSERRARQDKRREQAVVFITEVGDNFNKVYARIYGHLRLNNMQVYQDAVLMEARGKLFTQRTSVKMKSRVYLNSDEFWQKYEVLIWQFTYVTDIMSKLTDASDVNAVVAEIQKHQEKLRQKWPLVNEDSILDLSHLQQHYAALSTWTDMLVERSDWLLTRYLTAIFK